MIDGSAVHAAIHVTVAVDDRGPYVDGSIADRRLDELAAGGVALIRDVGRTKAPREENLDAKVGGNYQ